jgi:hypothetical protein
MNYYNITELISFFPQLDYTATEGADYPTWFPSRAEHDAFPLLGTGLRTYAVRYGISVS